VSPAANGVDLAGGSPARAAWTTALDILTDLGHPDADAVRAKLATVTRRATSRSTTC